MNKLSAERNQRLLVELVTKPGNGSLILLLPTKHSLMSLSRYLCGLQGKKSALGVIQSWNFYLVSGILLKITVNLTRRITSVSCASIHRKIGTHITKVLVILLRLRSSGLTRE
jgi:hypothetical protein